MYAGLWRRARKTEDSHKKHENARKLFVTFRVSCGHRFRSIVAALALCTLDFKIDRAPVRASGFVEASCSRTLEVGLDRETGVPIRERNVRRRRPKRLTSRIFDRASIVCAILEPTNGCRHRARGVEQPLPKRHSRTRRASVGSSVCAADQVTVTCRVHQSLPFA